MVISMADEMRDRKDKAEIAELGRKLLCARERKNMTQALVAEHAGISPSFLNKIETGKSSPSAIILARLTKVLGEDIRNFVDHVFTIEEVYEKEAPQRFDDLGLAAMHPINLDFKTKKALLKLIEQMSRKKK
jgi:transcriptional regulator with XRE-family HTH domain